MPTTALVEALYAAICPFVPALTVPPPAPTVHAPPAGTACPAELNCTHWPLIGAVPRVATPPDVLGETPRTAPTPDAIPLPDWFMIWLSGVSVGAAGELLPLPMTYGRSRSLARKTGQQAKGKPPGRALVRLRSAPPSTWRLRTQREPWTLRSESSGCL
jgi:hypothetical protein